MNRFDPVRYSLEENSFFLSSLGQPPVVALKALPLGVNPNAVKPVLDRVYELEQLRTHSGQAWLGVDGVKDAISTYLREAERWSGDRRRGAPRFPSMASYDSKGKPHRYGPGSDAGQVSTYFDSTGARHPFAIDLVPDGVGQWSAPWGETDKPAAAGLTLDSEKHRYECFCGHTESFNVDSNGSKNAARARMSKHLRTAKTETEKHREIHTNEFGG